jgi:hypothetical protein
MTHRCCTSCRIRTSANGVEACPLCAGTLERLLAVDVVGFRLVAGAATDGAPSRPQPGAPAAVAIALGPPERSR